MNVNFYHGKRKNSPIEKIFYFKDSRVIWKMTASPWDFYNSKIKGKLTSDSYLREENYGIEYVKRIEKISWKKINN
ncbi:hypothetical protein GCM10023163_23660 [Aestuariibaculum suncheonense]